VTLEQLEKAAIIQAIEACRGNLSLAAKSLGLGRATLYRKLRVYSIDPKDMKSKNKRRVA
jgi:transcriptional regulator of acetoin/glycerol metabolism